MDNSTPEPLPRIVSRMSPTDFAPVDWVTTPGLVPYEAACAAMTRRVDAIAKGNAPELVWLIEHPALYTAGTSAKVGDLLEPGRFPVHATGRGGQFTYHGPGQRVGYVMLDVRRRFGDVRAYVGALEGLLVDTLAAFGVTGETIAGRVGVWVRRRGSEADADKIAAIGVRLSRWVSSHGFSLNVAPDLSHFAGIVPCGIREQGVTSLAALGVQASLAQVDLAVRGAFEQRFGATRESPAISGDSSLAQMSDVGAAAPRGAA